MCFLLVFLFRICFCSCFVVGWLFLLNMCSFFCYNSNGCVFVGFWVCFVKILVKCLFLCVSLFFYVSSSSKNK